MDRVNVPCGSCHLCCKLHTPLQPDKGDDIASYDWARWFVTEKDGARVLKGFILWRRPNGDCVYLTDSGCSIWHRAPYACRTFDCRAIFKNSDRAGRKLAVKRGEMPRAIFDRGRELLEQA